MMQAIRTEYVVAHSVTCDGVVGSWGRASGGGVSGRGVWGGEEVNPSPTLPAVVAEETIGVSTAFAVSRQTFGRTLPAPPRPGPLPADPVLVF